jgi:predicted transcriptional regulator
MIEDLLKNSTQLLTEKNNCQLFIKCIFNLNLTDLNILNLLTTETGMKIADLIDKTQKNHSTIYRSLEKLIRTQLVYKERRGNKPKGFVDYYYRIPDQDLFSTAEKKLDSCYTQLKELLQYNKKIGHFQ